MSELINCKDSHCGGRRNDSLKDTRVLGPGTYQDVMGVGETKMQRELRVLTC